MISKLFILSALLVFFSFASVAETPGTKPAVVPAKPQTTCPVMGGKINKKWYIDIKGKRIYVCCPGCTKLIRKTPDKYIKKLENQGVKLEAAPKSKPKAVKANTPATGRQ